MHTKRAFATESFMAIALLLLIVATVFHSYMLFHINVEIFSTLIAFSIFVFGWNTRQSFKNSYLLVIAVAYLFIGFLDIFHALTYESMNIFNYPANFAIELWIAARLMEAVTFVIAYLFLKRAVSAYKLVAGYALATLLAVALIYGDLFPDCYVPGEGLTPFKVAMEYLIVAILIVSLWLLRRSEALSVKVKQLLSVAIVITIFAELSFTLYHDMFGIFNIIGHILKVVSFYLLYRAVLSVGLSEPMEMLTTRLNASEQARREQEEILIQQSRVAAMGEMVTAIAHHWRQPLSVVALTIQGLRDEYDEGTLDGQRIDEVSELLMSRLMEMSHTIDSLRGLVPKEEGRRLCCVLDEVKAAYRVIQAELKSTDITLDMDCFHRGPAPLMSCECGAGEQQWVRMIPAEFRQVVFGVLINARDAILARRLREDNPHLPGRIHMRLDFEEDEELFVIEDNGGGVPPEALERIFEPFFTTKERGQGRGVITGVGLGLYTAKLVIEERMGGAITIENHGEGARVSIRLPLKAA
jgi:signal transduction histidine kinase